MKAEAVIRPMSSTDLDQVLKIEHQVFTEPWSRKSYEFEIHKNRFSIAVVLEYEHMIIGSAVVWIIFEEFHIATLSISPAFQGQGWGSYLLKKLLEMAEGTKYALLEVRKSNYQAIKLYEKFGFSAIGKRHHYYRNGEDAIIMKKELQKTLRGGNSKD